MRYNAAGAFLGTLVDNIHALTPSYGTPDTRLMLFNSFLTTPLLNLDGKTEQRFTDHNGLFGDDDEASLTDMDLLIGAFTHFTLSSSHGTLIVTDVQGISPPSY